MLYDLVSSSLYRPTYFHRLYQGRHTLCWVFATSFLWLTEWNFSWQELFSRIFCVGAMATTQCLFADVCRASSLDRWRDVRAMLCFRSVGFVSSGAAEDWGSLGASPWVSAWPGPLSMVLKTSSLPLERHSLLESCDNIQRSLPFKLSVISKYWLTFARQLWKPVWKSGNSEAATAPESNGKTS